MRNSYIIFITCFLLMLSFIGCVSYSTLQSAKTIDPGKVLVGCGSSVPVTSDGAAFIPEFNARIGVNINFDMGVKYILPSLFFVDGKVQLINDPIAFSIDLGWSHFSYTGDVGTSSGTSTGLYPMLIVGQDHWYVGIKRVYFSTEGEFEFFGLNKFEGSGWISTNIVAGGIIGNTIRFLPEVNIIISDNGKALIVPAVGLQFVL